MLRKHWNFSYEEHSKEASIFKYCDLRDEFAMKANSQCVMSEPKSYSAKVQLKDIFAQNSATLKSHQIDLHRLLSPMKNIIGVGTSQELGGTPLMVSCAKSRGVRGHAPPGKMFGLWKSLNVIFNLSAVI